MKREVERERVLPAFSLNFGELDLLVSRLLALFEEPQKVHSSINVALPSEQLEFSNVQELREYEQLPARIADFAIRLWHERRSVCIRSGRMNRIFAFRAQVSATAETESWCAGAIDTVYTFVASHKVWYNWFLSIPIGWGLVILGSNVPIVSLAFVSKDHRIDGLFVFAWIGAFVALLLLYFGRERLLPSAAIRVSEGGGFVRNHIAELSLALAILSVALTVVGWFVTK